MNAVYSTCCGIDVHKKRVVHRRGAEALPKSGRGAAYSNIAIELSARPPFHLQLEAIDCRHEVKSARQLMAAFGRKRGRTSHADNSYLPNVSHGRRPQRL